MSYCNTKDKEKSRMNAVKEVLVEERSVAQVARKYGCHRSTIYRWLKRYEELKRSYEIKGFSTQRIPTVSSRPKTSPSRLPEWLVGAIVSLRKELNRCAEIVWYEAKRRGLEISLSSVRRIIKRKGLQREVSKWKRYRKFSKRPKADHPGALVEVDSVHFYHPITKHKVYATSVIDVYSRMAYVSLHEDMKQASAIQAVLEAKTYLGINFETILREECLGDYISTKETLDDTNFRLRKWLDFYNLNRVHLGLGFATPFEKCCEGVELN